LPSQLQFSLLSAFNKKAVINGIKMLKVSCEVALHTDNLHIKEGITEWINRSKTNGWKWSIKNSKNVAEAG
jgi:ribonuclease HI